MNITELNQREILTVSGGFLGFTGNEWSRILGGMVVITGFVLLDKDSELRRRLLKGVILLTAAWGGNNLFRKIGNLLFCAGSSDKQEL